MDGPSEPNADLTEQFQKRLAVIIVQVAIFSVIAPGRDVVEGTRKFES